MTKVVTGFLAALFAAVAVPAAAQVPTPEAHFGFRIGADRQLASAEAIEKYFETVNDLRRRGFAVVKERGRSLLPERP